jgi:hypothetical protein
MEAMGPRATRTRTEGGSVKGSVGRSEDMDQADVQFKAFRIVRGCGLKISIKENGKVVLRSSSIGIHQTRANPKHPRLGAWQGSAPQIIIGKLLEYVAVDADPEILENLVLACEIHVERLAALITCRGISRAPKVMCANRGCELWCPK